MKKESEALYQVIYNASKLKRRRALSNIKKACDSLEKNSRKLTIALIGRFCEKKFKEPQTQSIRNVPEYKKYIKLREKERNKIKTEKIDYEEHIIVKDQSAQAIIDILQDEIKVLKKRLSSLKSGMRQIVPVDIDKFISENFGVSNPPCDLITSSYKDNRMEKNIEVSLQIDLILKDIVEVLNKNLYEKYSNISIEYKNDKIFNKLTGTIYWERDIIL